MGADFLYAYTELPTGQPIAELEAKIRHILTTDDDNRERIADLIYGGALSAGDTEGQINEMVDDYTRMLRKILSGEYDRYLGVISTYNEKGQPIVLWVTGEMSWGDSHECLNAMWAIQELGQRWWEIDLPEN